MDFQNLTPEPTFIHQDGSMVSYETMASLSSASSPRPDFEYSGLMVSTPIPMASPYGLTVPMTIQQPMTPDPSPVDHVQVEFIDLAAPYPEDRSYKPRKQDGKAQPSTSMHMRRRAQNRASQRAFRERKEKHTQDLQRRLDEVEHQFDCLKQRYEQCQREKGELEVQARRCSCTGLESMSSASECDSPMTDTSAPASLTSGSSSGSAGTPGRSAAAGTSAASSRQDSLNLGIPAGIPVVGGMHDLDTVYWGNQC